MTFNGTPITGTNIGIASDNNWGFTNSQSYRADVTSLVTGNAAYSLSQLRQGGPPTVDINGVSLIVFYNDANSVERPQRRALERQRLECRVRVRSCGLGRDDLGRALPGVGYCEPRPRRLRRAVVSTTVTVVLNGNTGDPVVAGPSIFQGDSGRTTAAIPSGVTGSLWDVKSFDITRSS